MENLSPATIAKLLQPYLSGPAEIGLCERIAIYLDLLARWNGRVSLTSVREPAQIVQRHFGESLFLAERLPNTGTGTLLDLGSGAGFPGIPTALLRPGLHVTLAESQGKKASFLREAVSELKLSASVWADRIERMPETKRFDVVALRAVDKMETALQLAAQRLAPGGTLAFLAGENSPEAVANDAWSTQEFSLPLSAGRLVLSQRIPRNSDRD